MLDGIDGPPKSSSCYFLVLDGGLCMSYICLLYTCGGRLKQACCL